MVLTCVRTINKANTCASDATSRGHPTVDPATIVVNVEVGDGMKIRYRNNASSIANDDFSGNNKVITNARGNVATNTGDGGQNRLHMSCPKFGEGRLIPDASLDRASY
ncbi:hypothetical protein HAX54_040098 [Datura stramonium]|uniref:Uncharacterized protein n=1 Tax=Datura stramonium TaxID=4076 RepID=A0ABS8VNR3_DATST|nr:hypothetical protein [Datura stramonium]